MSGDPAYLDYDRVALTYDRRFEGRSEPGTLTALLALARQAGARRVLEVGCGTGRWLAGLRPITDDLHGLDVSPGMLHQARKRAGPLLLTRGQAASLPFASASFDLVFCVNAIHHFASPADWVLQARRVLRSGGVLAVIGSDPRHPQHQWYAYDYFEDMLDRDLERFPSWGTVLNWMVKAGFVQAEWRPAEHIQHTWCGRQVREDPFLEKPACSQLALLSDQAYDQGIQRIEAAVAAASAAGTTLCFSTSIWLHMLSGRAP
jgi:ubiquinone/menaquinone biosynthesis C-methylase UbiE